MWTPFRGLRAKLLETSKRYVRYGSDALRLFSPMETVVVVAVAALVCQDAAIAQRLFGVGAQSQARQVADASADIWQDDQDLVVPEPPIGRIAHDLGLSADRVHDAFRIVGPPTQDGLPPTAMQAARHAQALALALKVPVDTLEPVLEKYRLGQPPRRN